MMSTFTPPPWLDQAAYPFTHRFAPLSSGRMHYVDEGQGDTLLFVHGTPTWSFEFRHLIKALAPSYRCVAPDHFGFGLSDRPADFPYTPEAHAVALEEFVDRAGLERFTLVVHDYGGPIGLPLALDRRTRARERVRRLMLLNTWMWPFDEYPNLERKARLAGGALGRWLYKDLNASIKILMPSAYGDRKKLTPEIHRQYLEVFRDKAARVLVLHALARALNGSRDYYARLWTRSDALVGRPALIVWGMKDAAFKANFLKKWQERLPAARVVRLPDAGHWPHEEQPLAVVDALRDWLQTGKA
jgi:haloalkane dehalogenase